MLQVIFFGSMAYYYIRQSSIINRKLRETSSLLGNNARVAQFSKNVKIVGRALALTTVLLLGSLPFVLLLEGQSISYYLGLQVIWAIAIPLETAQAYFLIISVEMAYGKHIVGPHLGFASMWGPTLYTNTISVPPMLAIGMLSSETERLGRIVWTSTSISLLLVSCAVGVAISYLGWRARSLVTATCYTVLGVANKMLTVLGNAFMAVALVLTVDDVPALVAELQKVQMHVTLQRRMPTVSLT